MSISANVFPLSMAKLTGGPRFNTDITVGKSGAEVRNANWQDALWEYNAAYAISERADVYALNVFFLNCRGREIAFNLQAGDDYKIPHSSGTPQSIGTAASGQTQFQIYKRYTDLIGSNYDRIITRPSDVTSELAVYDNGVLQSGNYSYSTTTGIITFTSGRTSGHVISITLAKFYVPVRFDIDKLDVDMLLWWVKNGADYSQHQIPNIPMIEVRNG